ncbi:MAG TPA: GNAT family N-acetyltransferase [Actinomycetota bacterium]
MTIEVRPAALAAVRELRHLVLRPHQLPEDLVYEHDDDPDALHLGAFEDGRLVAVASITREPPPGSDDGAAWRIRGMATLPDYRGRGLGGELLRRCIGHATPREASLVWCNGRVPALRFYERHGFVGVRGPWDEPHLGPHVELHLRLRTPETGPPEARWSRGDGAR